MANPTVDTKLRGGRRPPVVDAGPMRRHLPLALARQLDAARQRRNLSVRQLGRLAGIGHAMAAYLCTGERVPSIEVAHRVIGALDLNSDVADELLAHAVERAWR